MVRVVVVVYSDATVDLNASRNRTPVLIRVGTVAGKRADGWLEATQISCSC